MNTQNLKRSDYEAPKQDVRVTEVLPKGTPLKDLYRYFCERCTGVAFKNVVKEAPVSHGQQLCCSECHQPVILPLKQENFIAL